MVVQNEEHGQPLANVAVSAPGANGTTTASNGTFTLRFAQAEPGEKVRLIIQHRGWAVVNKWALELNLPSEAVSTPVEFILCKQEELEQRIGDYLRLRFRATAAEQYRAQLAKLKDQHTATQQELADLQSKFEKLKRLTDDQAKELAKALNNKTSTPYQEYLAPFVAGKLDEVLQRLEKQEEQLAKNWQLRAQTLALKFDFSGASRAYLTATQIWPKDPALWLSSGHFHYKQNQFKEAGEAYQAALAIYRQQAQANPSAYLPNLAMTLNNLGNLHATENRRSQALAAYEEALSIYRQLAQVNPSAYLPDLATTLNNLGELHAAENRLPQALAAYEEALRIFQQFAQISPSGFTPYVQGVERNIQILKSPTP